tara:strand:+ start:415 stop:1365 length:951 start_codon:yes stop_codon:yes gene_type:complete
MEIVDEELYNEIKKKLYIENPQHSAYRSGSLVKKYKEEFAKKYGPNKTPYKGNKTKKKGLTRWFAEEWKNQRGDIGYKYKNDVYRPTIRITKKTPITFDELSEKSITKARSEKYRKGHVTKFNGGRQTRKNKEKSKIYFADYPDFLPNLSPREMFEMGSFGGTYWRPIYSSITKKDYKNRHKRYPLTWWNKIPTNFLTREKYDININKYKVRVGTSLEFWEEKGWIDKLHPYGWVEWYCDFYQGKRGVDDERQIMRWKNLAGPRGRFMRFLVTQIIRKKSTWNDEAVSPKIRQVLQHWGYVLTKKDYTKELKRREL